MAKGFKTGGRKKGSLNKKTLDLLRICEEEGIEPFREMIRHYKRLRDAKDAFDAAERICQYLIPKKRAIEHSVAPEKQEAMEEFENLPKEEQIHRLEEAMESLKESG